MYYCNYHICPIRTKYKLGDYIREQVKHGDEFHYLLCDHGCQDRVTRVHQLLSRLRHQICVRNLETLHIPY